MKVYFITGGCGFIGSNYIHHLLENNIADKVINLDKITYAGNLENLNIYDFDSRYHFVKGDICHKETIISILEKHSPDVIVHFAAESHVDRSIDGPAEFIQTNVVGTLNMLHESYTWANRMGEMGKNRLRFIHVSTDEVYGSLGETGKFLESTPYDPSSPYSASKASSDHLARAWFRTYGFPVLITNCSNNYGPYQFPEKLIPLMIINALAGKPLPVYGDGLNVRDWLFVRDHCQAIQSVIENGQLGETYNIGGNNEITNIEIVETICTILDQEIPSESGDSYKELITFVSDRPGHDFRYAIDATKIEKECGWTPKENFESGIKKSIQWYLKNKSWWKNIQEKKYSQERLGKI
ncbi:MAG: dTDP-glucose 4,6-dehydratase [Candidatus Marinimicrobia bacterium]|nr:dTDP-glucose 4,6-dehydratase [Candidatus Neomarinimicrobiota bacterium]